MFNNTDWLSQVREAVVDPAREIVDPHHHLWPKPHLSYDLEELWADTQDGHKVVQTVFMECGAAYRTDGPEHLKPVGETEFVTAAAERAAKAPEKAQIAGIIAHADLRRADLDTTLDAHAAAAKGRFRGIRHAGSFDADSSALLIPGRGPAGLYADPDFRRGVARLGERGLTYDTWMYHHQLPDYAALAAAVPGTTMILDHFGTPLGVGQYAGKRAEIFAKWKDDIAAVAANRNVHAKIGGLAMPDNGFGWNGRDKPPTSDEFVEAQAPWYHHTIKVFGPERCMFESNFPVDRLSLSYRTLWNGLKKIAKAYPEAAQAAMFSGTARKVYKL
ncbi:MAG: amidohydrolase family protein [Hyphomonas sp.]|uniref:amidohydrolase family protein n=1 Tax=Hyphomonas sp. TaxID=87 RepID=UPI00184603C4|nr:amidohydrolase family protein [Hyphomonas sp.]MBA3070406.1 amidohydrolase family protein [Hyphomonas sp.]MBU4061719.1 amidohydrolase family protein [Alphaproteobacteria bacterium]MBU4164527.1 amidohydrolase family protein [Alphaproteobacteria bacterium]MBU4568141.1 amidohydrolase family protein [Alphaproteobacteria bacterium]